jgi:hypothetical protein
MLRGTFRKPRCITDVENRVKPVETLDYLIPTRHVLIVEPVIPDLVIMVTHYCSPPPVLLIVPGIVP